MIGKATISIVPLRLENASALQRLRQALDSYQGTPSGVPYPPNIETRLQALDFPA
jgi:hypothetical protein